MMSYKQTIIRSFASPLRWGASLGVLALMSACGPSQNSSNSAPVAQGNAAVNSAALAPVVVRPPVVTNGQPGNTIIDNAAGANFAAGAAEASLPAAGQAIDQAQLQPAAASVRVKPAAALPYDPTLVKAEVLLDRAGFSPGVIDGRDGENFQHALVAFATSRGLASTGALDQATWNALIGGDSAPAVETYVITAADEAGPFIGAPPKTYPAMAKLGALSYSGPEQALAERFHVDQKLLEALNPGADFSKTGQVLLVVSPRTGPRDFDVSRIEVDKTEEVLRAYGPDGKLVAFYPASVGSTERPAPSGVFAVAAVAPHPAYYYDPARLTFTAAGAKGNLRIAPGPNNPVGLTWIALTIPTYGIHGSPDPTTIGKHQSHGCVRLTNWDAVELGKAVKKGVQVDFVGQDKAPGART
jgi:lipoprotein-anchoring transpeptidase ErfK/SrfK